MSNAKTLDQKTQGSPTEKVAAAQMQAREANAKAAEKTPVTARRGRLPVDPNENPAKKFHRLAVKRMTKALKAISYVGNLGNKRQYQYTDEQRNKILKSLADAVSDVVRKFSEERSTESSFTL